MIKAAFELIKSEQKVIIRDVSAEKRKEYLMKQNNENILKKYNSEANYKFIYNKNDNKINEKNVLIKTKSNEQKILNNSVSNGSNNNLNMGNSYNKYIATVHSYEPSENLNDNNNYTYNKYSIEKSISNNSNNQQIEKKNSEIIGSNNLNEVIKINEINPSQQQNEIILSTKDAADIAINNQLHKSVCIKKYSENNINIEKYIDFVNNHGNYQKNNSIDNYNNFEINKMNIIPMASNKNNNSINISENNNNIYNSQNQLINNSVKIQNYNNNNNQLSNSMQIDNKNINNQINNSMANPITYPIVNQISGSIGDNDAAGITEIHSVKYISAGDDLKLDNNVNYAKISKFEKNNEKVVSNMAYATNDNIENNNEVGMMKVSYITYPVNHVVQYNEKNTN